MSLRIQSLGPTVRATPRPYGEARWDGHLLALFYVTTALVIALPTMILALRDVERPCVRGASTGR